MSKIEEYTRFTETGICMPNSGEEVEIVAWEQVIKNTKEFCESQFSEMDENFTIADRLTEVAAALRKANNLGGK